MTTPHDHPMTDAAKIAEIEKRHEAEDISDQALAKRRQYPIGFYAKAHADRAELLRLLKQQPAAVQGGAVDSLKLEHILLTTELDLESSTLKDCLSFPHEAVGILVEEIVEYLSALPAQQQFVRMDERALAAAISMETAWGDDGSKIAAHIMKLWPGLAVPTAPADAAEKASAERKET